MSSYLQPANSMDALRRRQIKAMMEMGSPMAHPEANGVGADSVSKSFVSPYRPGNTYTTNYLYDTYRRISYIDEKALFWGLVAIAVLLMIVSSLIAGLILAISPLDITWLNVMSVTGSDKRRKRAQRVAQIRRRGTWFLTSMIIMATIMNTGYPIIIQALFGMSWLVILVSVFFTIFFVELLPQYLMLRQPLAIASVCWPFIWGIMWFTAPISYPIAWCLDRLVLPKPEKDMYNQEQLSQLIKLHERREKHGGNLGPDPGRIMRGALDLDGRTMMEPYASGALQDGSVRREKSWDIEIANSGRTNVIVAWSSVKYVNIDEEVDAAFIRKLRGWAYSRLPVLGDGDAMKSEMSVMDSWNGKRIFGFLHIKNLLGLDVPSNNPLRRKLLVRDLPLYPLPIVRDDLPIYDLLNMFQLGMSRIAIVIEAPPRGSRDWMSTEDSGTVIKKSGNSEKGSGRGAPLWTASEGIRHRASVDANADRRVDWTADLIEAAQKGVESEEEGLSIKVGIGCPRPLGIVTFEDIIDTLMQKTSRDEKDFFDRKTFNPPTKRRKEGDSGSVRSTKVVYRSKRAVPVFVDNLQSNANAAGAGTLRRRNVSGMSGTKGAPSPVGKAKLFGMDGQTDNHHPEQSQSVDSSEASSSTRQSRGVIRPSLPTAAEEVREQSVYHRLRRLKGRSNLIPGAPKKRPSMEASREFAELGVAHINPSQVSIEVTSNIGRMYDVPKSSREVFSSLDEVPMSSMSEDITDAMPISPTTAVAVNGLRAPVLEKSSSRAPSEIDIAAPKKGTPTTPPLSSSSSEGSHDSNKENKNAGPSTEYEESSYLVCPRSPSKLPLKPLTTLPRSILRGGPASRHFTSQGIKLRERSFHDDRAMLPSQRKGDSEVVGVKRDGGDEGVARSSSFWV